MCIGPQERPRPVFREDCDKCNEPQIVVAGDGVICFNCGLVMYPRTDEEHKIAGQRSHVIWK